MAAHNNSLAMDPALVKYNNMSANRWRYFRWTPRTAWITFVYVVAIPSAVGYVGFVTDQGKDQDDAKPGNAVLQNADPSTTNRANTT